MAEPAVVKALGGNAYAAKKTIQAARRCKEDWLRHAVQAFAGVDAQLKQGLLRDNDALLLAILEVF